MEILITLILLAINFLFGTTLLRYLYKNDLKKYELGEALLAIILGFGLSTLFIFLMEILFIPLRSWSIWPVLLGLTGIIVYLDYKKNVNLFNLYKIRLSVFDIIPLVIIMAFGLITIWRTYYYPPYSYDSMMGIDIIAKYTLRDGSIANSELFREIVTRNGVPHSNQLFYAPFTMLNQVLYRIAGIAFGQIWLGVLSTIFWIYFYVETKRYIHSVFAIICTLLVICSPELYAYSFILQTDWSNAIYLFVGVLYFYKYFSTNHKGHLYISMAGMFLACWTRTETLFFVPFGSLYLLILVYLKKREISKEILTLPVLYTAVPLLAVVLWNFFFVKLYLPSTPDLMNQINLNFSNLSSEVGNTIESMNKMVVFNDVYWGYIVSAFMSIVVLSIPFAIKDKKYKGKEILLWLIVLYLVFVFLITQFPAVTIQNTFRRGFFKFIPLFAFFIAVSPFMQWINKVLLNK